MLGYRPFYNAWDFPDPDPEYIADPDEGGLIQVEVAAPHIAAPSILPWILGGLLLFALMSDKREKPRQNPPKYSRRHPLAVSGYRVRPYYRRKRR